MLGKNVLGDICGKRCVDVLCGDSGNCHTDCPVKKAFFGTIEIGEMAETKIGDMDFEFTTVPFQGYSDDRLSMILMRDISLRKKHERELRAFNNDIEDILRIKIDE